MKQPEKKAPKPLKPTRRAPSSFATVISTNRSASASNFNQFLAEQLTQTKAKNTYPSIFPKLQEQVHDELKQCQLEAGGATITQVPKKPAKFYKPIKASDVISKARRQSFQRKDADPGQTDLIKLFRKYDDEMVVQGASRAIDLHGQMVRVE